MPLTQPIEFIELIDKTSSTKALFIPEYGGMISSLQMQGRELMYLTDIFYDQEANDLRGGLALCFPVVGRLKWQNELGAYHYNDSVYHLPIHGFSWLMPWSVKAQSRDQLTLTLSDNERTHEMYPFKFEIQLHYEIAHNKLICRQSYKNLDDKPLPYYAGFHPYFRVEKSEDNNSDVTLNYNPMRRFLYNPDYTDILREMPLFNLPSRITNPDLNEQLTQLGQIKVVTLQYQNGDSLHMTAEGVEDPNLFPYIQLYTVPDEPFFCVEPWMRYPNAMNREDVRWLSPGQSEHGMLTISLVGRSQR